MNNYTPWTTSSSTQSSAKKKPKISVFVPINRVGGMDVLFESLKHQSFQDFELIIGDSLYEFRKDVVAEKAKEYNFPVKHISPINKVFPITDYNNAINTGLLAAEGDIFYFTSDFSVMPKDTLALHHSFHTQTPKNFILMCPCNDAKVKLDVVSDDFPKHRQYGNRGNGKETQLYTVPEDFYISTHNEWSERFCEDLKNGVLNKVLWSIFKEPFIYERGIEPYVEEVIEDTKFSNCSKTEPTQAFHDLCCIRANSFRTDFLLEANGMNELFDGTWGVHDTELIRRLVRCYDAKTFAMNIMGETVINTRYFQEIRKCPRGYDNFKLIEQSYGREQPINYGVIAEWKQGKIKLNERRMAI